MSQAEIEALARALRAHARKIEDLKDAQGDLETRLETLKAKLGEKPKSEDEDGDGNPFS